MYNLHCKLSNRNITPVGTVHILWLPGLYRGKRVKKISREESVCAARQ
ncbi:hypothetical protein HMPREF9080_01889 [Cardiobacterium valvarum F0432]|uniref:Uncharacterized protein n=1 Tax=Cardiobacterium valvarum F0432 TaxID=797473 RepID=G9ZGI5_9GAMM|nr:hypothetical protein HMPREF9080_01889 [Cardiobacterium valvarum F0432]